MRGEACLNNAQRVFLAVYMPAAVLILVLDNLFTGESVVQYVKYSTMVTLFLAAAYVKKSAPEQRLMSIALLFVVIADFFLGFLPAITGCKFTAFGVGAFALAYICLIIANQKNFRLGRADIITALLIGGISMLAFYGLELGGLKGVTLLGLISFGVILTYMTWTMICTLFRHYYRLKVCYCLALAGILMYISDLAVAYVHFNLAYTALYQPWMQNLAWAFYIPAWTIIALVISEEDPYR
ncbi:MAG: hypothetical protein GXZ09_00335 [Syntrophomonadaceae bacterium]|jgi:hypothetical protein|nr:hypothetical protein [Syntrophomonadaceae bacterium]